MVPGFRKFTQTLVAFGKWNPLGVKTGSKVQVDRIWVSALGGAAVSPLQEGGSIREFQGVKTWSALWRAGHKVWWSLSGECSRMRFKTHLDADQRRSDRERKEGARVRESRRARGRWGCEGTEQEAWASDAPSQGQTMRLRRAPESLLKAGGSESWQASSLLWRCKFVLDTSSETSRLTLCDPVKRERSPGQCFSECGPPRQCLIGSARNVDPSRRCWITDYEGNPIVCVLTSVPGEYIGGPQF